MKLLLSFLTLAFFISVSSCKKTEESGSPQSAIDSNQKKMGDTNKYGAGDTSGNKMAPGSVSTNVSPDFKFAVDAADGGMAEVKLAELAQKNASDKMVKEFAKKMVADHTKAENELKALAQKKNITMPDKISDKNQKIYDDLAKKSGADFDKAYMDQMVSDHKSLVTDFETQSNSGKDQDLKEWATKTLPTLKHHLTMAQTTYDKVNAKPTAGK